MNWEALGAIGEFVAALGVIVTLIYLTTQIRQNTKSINSNNSNNVMQGFNHVNAALFSNPEVIGTYYRGLASPESLAPEELAQSMHAMASLMNIYRNLYHQFLDGTFPESKWRPWAMEAKQLMESPGGVHFRRVTMTYEDLFKYLEQQQFESGPPLDLDGLTSNSGGDA